MVARHNKDAVHFLTIPVDQIQLDPDNIRRTKGGIEGLKQTISDVGLLQPILISRTGKGRYVIVDGERRFEAIKALGITELIVGREAILDAEETVADRKFKQVIANIQREDVNDIELGHAFVQLKEQFGYQYREIAEIVGKTPHYVTAKVGLAKRLTPEVQAFYVRDLEAAKCIPDTSGNYLEENPAPYIVNATVLERIARLPAGLQMPSFIAIKHKKMDKNEALSYLHSIRTNSSILKITEDINGIMDAYSTNKADNEYYIKEKALKSCLNRLNRDVDRLMLNMRSGGCAGDNEIVPLLETLMDKLRSLYSELKAGQESPDTTMMTG